MGLGRGSRESAQLVNVGESNYRSHHHSRPNPLVLPNPAKIAYKRPLAGVMFAPALKSVLASFGSTSETVAALLVAIFVTGYAAGPLLWAPLSELYGRAAIVNLTNVLFLLTNVGSGFAPSLEVMIIARFLGGFFSSSAFVLGGGIINDVILPEFQGKVMAIYSFGALLSPLIGPMLYLSRSLVNVANARQGRVHWRSLWVGEFLDIEI
jgi:MFS family permease